MEGGPVLGTGVTLASSNVSGELWETQLCSNTVLAALVMVVNTVCSVPTNLDPHYLLSSMISDIKDRCS